MARDLSEWQWWTAPKGSDQIASLITAQRERLRANDGQRRRDLSAMRSVYLDVESDYYEHIAYSRSRRSRFNLTQGAVDATHAQMITNRPRPKVDTIGADYHARRKAKLRQTWIDGYYEQINGYEMLSSMALDGLIYGSGALKVYPSDGRVKVDRVWTGDLWVDPREERYQSVNTLYQINSVDKGMLIAEFPEHADAIDRAKPSTDETLEFPDLDIGGDWRSPDLVEVIEAWRLPTLRKPKAREGAAPGTPKLGSGRHVIVLDGVVLLDEEWTLDRFPFVIFNWAMDPQRFFGQGMVERAVGMQSDLNELTSIIQETYSTMVPQLWVDTGSGIDVSSLNDVVGKVNRCSPANGDVRLAIQLLSPDVGQGLLQREQEIAGRFLPTLGVDMLGAQAEKPAGLNSGAALRNYKEFTGGRFISAGRRYDQNTVDLANLIFHFADELAEAGEKQTLEILGGKSGLELVQYDDVRPSDGERFMITVKPASALPRDISGKVQTVLDWQTLGIPLSPTELAEMMEVPDLESALEGMNADRDLIMKAIDECGDPDAEQPTANAFWNRQLAMVEVTRAVQIGSVRGADEDTMKRLRLLHGHIRSLPDPNAPPPGAPPMGAAPGQMPMPDPGMAPPAPPGAPALPAPAGEVIQ